MSEATQVSVVIGRGEDGLIKKAYASGDAAVIIGLSNTVEAAGFEVEIFNCELITKAPRIRKSRTKEELRG